MRVQILEMDDDEDEREFSKSIVYDFFTQADGTFQKMDTSLQVSPSSAPFAETDSQLTLPSPHSESRDLHQLSQLGHFLKGSSATLGLTKVKDSCEKIQHYGAKKDETGTTDVDDDEACLKSLKEEIKVAKKEFKVVEGQLKRFYRDEGGS